MVTISSSGHAVSIHAPVKGATKTNAETEAVKAGFNSRSREGSDINF